MMASVRNMWLSSIVSSTLFVMAMSAGQEYLPPNKGYNYEPPSVPFNPSQPKPTPPAPRPVPVTRPTYIPPAPTPGPAPAPTQQPDQGYHYGHDHDHDHGHEDHHHHEPGMPFDFSYQVSEDDNNYSHNAISDGDVTRGEYRVALPDGRTQIVKYTADWKNGFNAEVTYEGEARYPDPPVGGYPTRGPSSGYGSGSNSGSGGSGGSGSTGGQAYVPPSQGGGYQY